MLSKKRKAARLRARWKATDDVASLLGIVTGSGVLEMSYLGNKYASEMDKEEYRNAIDNIRWSLIKKSQLLWDDVLKLGVNE